MSRFTIVFILSLLIILSLRFISFYSHLPVYKDGQYLSFETTLLSEPQIISRYQKFTANLNDGSRILVTLPSSPEFHYGDAVRIEGPVKFSRSPSSTVRTRLTEQLNGVNILSNKNRGVIGNDRIIKSMFFPKIEAVINESSKQFFLTKIALAVASYIRQNTVNLFDNTLPKDSSHLLLGIVFGIKEGMSKDFTNNLKIAGVLHVIAASGMNVAMVGAFFGSFFTIVTRRKIALVLTCTGIFFYALISGFEPSIIRATIMGTLAFCAQILGRQRLAAYSFFIAAFVMLFISPHLISDIGFQLSFFATLGLLYVRPLLDFGKRRSSTLIESIIVNSEIKTTLASQLAALPILLINFGTYSIFSILANAFVLWLVPTLMVLGGLASISSFIFEPVGKVFLYLAFPFLIYFEKVVAVFASFGQLEIAFPWQMAVGYYCILIAIILYTRSSREKILPKNLI